MSEQQPLSPEPWILLHEQHQTSQAEQLYLWFAYLCPLSRGILGDVCTQCSCQVLGMAQMGA